MPATFSLDPALVSTLKGLVDMLKKEPSLLQCDDLGFFRDYLTSLGAKVPKPDESKRRGSGASGDNNARPTNSESESKSGPKVEEVPVEDMDTEPEEPFPELPQEGVLGADEVDASQEMGDIEAEVSEEAMDKSNELKMEAVGLFGEGNFQGCVEKYTEAIKLNGKAAALFAKRGQAYLKLEKPNACIKDCTHALELNPDSAMAYKFRGRAHRLLGHWEEAASDLRQASKIDLDDQTDEWLKEVQPHARKVEEWRLRKKRRDEERELKERKARAQERARAHAEAQQRRANPEPADDGEDFGGMPDMFGSLLKDPEVAALLSDPEVAAAFEDIKSNPMNILKYQSNPKVAKVIQILQQKVMGGSGGGMPGGFGGMPGGMPGGFGGMPGGFPGGMPGGMPGGFGAGMPGGMPGGFSFGGPPPPEAAAPNPPPPKSGGLGDDLD